MVDWEAVGDRILAILGAVRNNPVASAAAAAQRWATVDQLVAASITAMLVEVFGGQHQLPPKRRRRRKP